MPYSRKRLVKVTQWQKPCVRCGRILYVGRDSHAEPVCHPCRREPGYAAAQRERERESRREYGRARYAEGYLPPSRRGTCSRCGKTIQITRTAAPDPVCLPCRRITPAPYGSKLGNDVQLYVYVCANADCAREFKRQRTMVVNDHPCCSRLCAAKVRFGDRVPADRTSYYLAKSRARRLRHAEGWDGVSDAEILDRDGWRCQIPGCKRRPIRQDVKYPHPRSKSIDHIIPLSLGGDDTAVNKRAAHLGCNVARGNKVGYEQLALIG